MMSDTLSLKLLKVDNWGIFFLQRLQESFSKSTFCDLTLKFSGEAKLKVHRLVLNTCTEYFLGLEKQGNHEPNCLQLPNELHPDVVLPIINFMYTGRLEFKEELQDQLYRTAKEMKMTILTRLLDAQSVPVPPVSKLQNKRATPPITYNLQGKKVIPKMVDPDLPEMLPGRKLPIWRRRNAPPSVPSVTEVIHAEEYECTPLKGEEPPRPTRFEWPEEEEGEELGAFSVAFDNISYDSKPLQRPKEPSTPVQPRVNAPPPVTPPSKPTVSFEELRKTVIHKRPANSPPSEAPGAKKKLVDIQEVKEYLQEQELRKNLVDTEEEGGNEDDDFDDSVPVADLDDEEEEEKDGSNAEDSLTVTENVSHVEVVEPVPSPSHHSESGSILESPAGQPQKSILKSRVSREFPETPLKRVRFSLEAELQEGKENEVKTEKLEQAVPQQAHPQTECSLTCNTPTPNNLSNHAKIISEVLKKYPHLVKDNKNIKLKIMQRGGQSKATVTSVDGDASKVVKSKVSYVVVKSNDSRKGKVVLKRGALTEPLSEFVNPEGQKPPSGAENTTGPWLCHSCGTNEEPINFETYYSYRKHLQDVHMEKIDARICEHCGHKASKRNLLLYHLYTRHGVPPPRNCQFPKCDQCDYVALSESLLIKHRNNHSNSKDFVCKVCNASFKSNGALQGHIQANLHGDPTKKKYECPYCRKPFVRNINLKAHIRSSHKEIARQLDGEEENLMENKKKKTRPRILDSGSTVLHIQGSGGTSEDGSHPEHTVLVLQSGEKVLTTSGMLQAPTLVPSSEAEALSNVASGIAASLGLNDSVSEISENGTQVQRQDNAGNSCSAFVIHDVSNSVHEYIVPDIISGDIEVAHSYSGQLAELEHYGGEEGSTCALDSNSGHLTAVSTANGTTFMDIAKQIPVLLADPNAQLHGNDFSGQRLTLVKDGVAIGVLVSQSTDTMGTTVLTRADGESSTMNLELQSVIPKLEKELPNAEGVTNEQMSTTYDGMPPILVREVPLDTSTPSGTSTVVLVTLPPSSDLGMQVAMRESDFEEAVKCFVLAQDGTTMSAAPQLTLMNAVPQEEIPRENPEKATGSTGKIGRIGILKKKTPDHLRMARQVPTAVPVVSGSFSPTKSSGVTQSQQIGILLPVDQGQKVTNVVPQTTQLSQLSDKLVVMSAEGAISDPTLDQSNVGTPVSEEKLVIQQMQAKDDPVQQQVQEKGSEQMGAEIKVLQGMSIPPQNSEVLGGMASSTPLKDRKINRTAAASHDNISTGVINSPSASFVDESFTLRLDVSNTSLLEDTLPLSKEVAEPCAPTVTTNVGEMQSQKILISLDTPGPNENVRQVEGCVAMQSSLAVTDKTASMMSQPVQAGPVVDSISLGNSVITPGDTPHENISCTKASGTVKFSDEDNDVHAVGALPYKDSSEAGNQSSSHLSKDVVEQEYERSCRKEVDVSDTSCKPEVHTSSTNKSSAENIVEESSSETKKMRFLEVSMVTGDDKTMETTKGPKDSNPVITSSGDLIIEESSACDSLVGLDEQQRVSDMVDYENEKVKSAACSKYDKVT
ncbi:Centrosomal Protein 190 [Ladona fulva]|uniref:Centrosomal Protein 190 n=1 Tax=Ladona fulva TaxID=123851 RepID=A0A8K0P5N0_LADFU|nr:Centrosomal Protein 190 [Ladona fulva]KAG8231799.1 Centrosomal Protein 190 [Ladona fulva]